MARLDWLKERGFVAKVRRTARPNCGCGRLSPIELSIIIKVK
jgi:hypothetical protein